MGAVTEQSVLKVLARNGYRDRVLDLLSEQSIPWAFSLRGSCHLCNGILYCGFLGPVWDTVCFFKFLVVGCRLHFGCIDVGVTRGRIQLERKTHLL